MPINTKNNRHKSSDSLWNTDIIELLSGKKRKLPLRDLAVFCRQTAFLLDAGLHLKEAMPLLAVQTRLRVISGLHSLIMQGESFSGALRTTGAFPVFMCAYVAIGERTANLPGIFSRLATYFEVRATAREELRAAMLYPCLVFAMMLGVIVLAVTLVLPGYADVFESAGVALPAATVVLLAVSGFLSANSRTVLLCLLLLFPALALFFGSKKGRMVSSSLALMVPILRHSVNYNLTQGLSALLDAGLEVSEAIPLCGEITGNLVVQKDLQKLSASVNSGVAFWIGLSEIPYIHPLLVSLTRIGENTGELPQTIEKGRLYFAETYRRELGRLNKLLVPIMTLIVGVFLAAVMLAVILPTFELAAVF